MAKAGSQGQDGGFTLLEVVVALALLGLLFAGAFGVFAAGMRASGASANHTRAVLEGERILNEMLAKGMPGDTADGVLDSGFRWKADKSWESSANNEGSTRLIRVQVSVWWPSFNGERQYNLVRLAMAPTERPAVGAAGMGNREPVPQPGVSRP